MTQRGERGRPGLLAALRGLFGGHTAVETPPPDPFAGGVLLSPEPFRPRAVAQDTPEEEAAPAPPPAPPVQSGTSPGAYRLRDNFLTPAEAAFFAVLRDVAGGRWLIMSKVRLADLVDPPSGREWQAAWNKISRKHVDFVLCDPDTVRPLVVLELDDRSHRRPDRIERDAFVDRVFADATLPILHIPVRRRYDPATLREMIQGTLAPAGPAGWPGEAAMARPQPLAERRCERCGGVMQHRVARKGAHAGESFWGCTNYPRCRHIVQLSA